MTTLFYALSFLSGFFETGPLMMALTSGLLRETAPDQAAISAAITRALICALCYQIGNLVPRPFELSKALVTAAGVLGFLCFTLALLPLPPSVVLAASLAGTSFVSACIQSARSAMKGGASKMFKRAARVAGFALGFFCTPVFAAAAAGLVLVFAVAALRDINAVQSRIILPRLNGLNVVMIFHQMHYFVYCYAAFIVAYYLGGRSAAVAAFLASWAVYVVSPLLYRKAGDLLKVFFFGHSLLVIVLAGLYFTHAIGVKIVLYLLTGVGGTTEFCIGGMAKKWKLYNADAQNFSENSGHVLGTAICLVLFIIGSDLLVTPLFAAIFALGAILCMAATIKTANKEPL